MSAFEKLLLNHPKSFDAAYGRARALDALAQEEDHDVPKVLQAIEAHEELLLDRGGDMDDSLFEKVAGICLDRLKFLGGCGVFDVFDCHFIKVQFYS